MAISLFCVPRELENPNVAVFSVSSFFKCNILEDTYHSRNVTLDRPEDLTSCYYVLSIFFSTYTPHTFFFINNQVAKGLTLNMG